MGSLFITTLNMSLTGAFAIVAICLARLALKKSSKIISYCLWAVVGFRLVFPFSIESTFSLIPFNTELIPPDITMQPMTYVDGLSFAGFNPLQTWLTMGMFVWLAGVVVMLSYGTVSYVILKRKLKSATHIEANIYETQMIKTPFVLGIFSPKIYLPAYLTAQERRYIVLHEQTHIRRRDNIVKFTACFILCIHWFNPLVWLAFRLMSMDMEMSCDERVLKELGDKTRKGYSMALLSLAAECPLTDRSLLAFGGRDIGLRIKNVLNPKKQSRVVCCVLVAFAVVLSVGLSVNRAGTNVAGPSPEQYSINEGIDYSDFVFERWSCCDEV